MKKIKKPLALRAETIRDLMSDELTHAAGGAGSDGCTASCPSNGCPPRTHTTTCPQ